MHSIEKVNKDFPPPLRILECEDTQWKLLSNKFQEDKTKDFFGSMHNQFAELTATGVVMDTTVDSFKQGPDNFMGVKSINGYSS